MLKTPLFYAMQQPFQISIMQNFGHFGINVNPLMVFWLVILNFYTLLHPNNTNNPPVKHQHPLKNSAENQDMLKGISVKRHDIKRHEVKRH